MGRIRNRKELREADDAAERRQDEDKEEADEDEEEEDEDESGASEAEEADAEEADAEEAEPEAKPKKRKAPAKPRSRAVKVTRMRVVWGVFDNANKCVATYEYPRRGDADDHAARLTSDKKNTHFVQPVKEPIEEKK
jgi:cobalamin biosynthesis protein CobT